MKNKIIVATVGIKSKREIKHFEIRIPENTNVITGIDMSVRLQDAITIPPSLFYDDNFISQIIMGDMRLQGAKDTTWFYAGYVKDSLQVVGEDFYILNTDMNLPFMVQGKTHMETLNVIPLSTAIKGFYKDSIGELLNQDLAYTLIISIHVETN